MTRFFQNDENSMKTFALIILAFSMLAFQREDPPPEPPVNGPACVNYGDNSTTQCHCPVAMRNPGEGRESDRPDRSKGESWCKRYCRDNCKCVPTQHNVMPAERL